MYAKNDCYLALNNADAEGLLLVLAEAGNSPVRFIFCTAVTRAKYEKNLGNSSLWGRS